jgi:hypothetical protein
LESAGAESWGVNVPPIRPGTPEISSVSFTGSGKNLYFKILGKKFGKTPQRVPAVGNTALLAYREPVVIKEV